MTRILICLSIALATPVASASAQDPAPAAPQQQVVSPPAAFVPPGELVPPADSVLPINPPQASLPWTYERQTQNPPGTVTNTHRYLDDQEGGRYVRQHVVTNPHHTMTQTWERVNTDDGYQYRHSQVWTNPDGTPLRQHERTWDGTSGTLERAAIGPGAPQREWDYSWTPDANSQYPVAGLPQPLPTTAVTSPIPSRTKAQTPAQSSEKLRWWRRLNPFRDRTHNTAAAAAAPKRRGFSIGKLNSHTPRPASIRTADRPSVRGSQHTHRPSWAGGPSRSARPQGPPAHANAQATASRGGLGRGPKR